MFPRLVCYLVDSMVKIKDLRSWQNLHTCCTRQYSNKFEIEEAKPPRDATARTQWLDEKAQKEINEMIVKNPEIARVKKILEMEFEVLKQDGKEVPNELRPRDWLELLNLSSKFKRR